jgi:nicotinamide-nucleotide amidase
MNHLSQVHLIAKEIGDKLKSQQLQLVTAESCTGGQLAQTITSVPGASQWFERGFVTYSNLSKQPMRQESIAKAMRVEEPTIGVR